jgi:ATP/ADP translocase
MNFSNVLNSDVFKSALQLSGLAILIVLVHTLVRSTSEVLAVTSLGNLEISDLKFLLFGPKLGLLIIFVLLYRLDRIKAFFYGIGSIFSIIFVLMAAFLYIFSGESQTYHLMVSITYMTSQMWPVVMYSMLFWVAANQRFTPKQAAFVYPCILIISGIGSLIGDIILVLQPHPSIVYLIVSVIIINLVYLCSFIFVDEKKEWASEKQESLGFIQKLTYIALLGLIFVTSDFVSQAFSLALKTSTKAAFTEAEFYTQFILNLGTIKGFITIPVVLLTSWMAWALGWRLSSLIPPLIGLGMMVVYWHAEMDPRAYETLPSHFPAFPMSSPNLILLTIFSTTFSGFSFLILTTKQMAFIPLPSSTKARANALLGLFLSGQAVSSMIFALFTSTSNGAPTALSFLYPAVIAVILWIVAVLLLGQRYNALAFRATVEEKEQPSSQNNDQPHPQVRACE